MQSRSNAIKARLKAEVSQCADDLVPRVLRGAGPALLSWQHVNTTAVVGEEKEKEFFWLEDTVLKPQQE